MEPQPPEAESLPPGSTEKRAGHSARAGVACQTQELCEGRSPPPRPRMHPLPLGHRPRPRLQSHRLLSLPPLAEIGGCVWVSVPGDGVLGNLTLEFSFWKRPVVVRLGRERDPLQGIAGWAWVRWGEGLLPRVVQTGRSPEPTGLRLLAGVSAQSFLHCFTLASAAFNLQVATPGGKTMDFVDVNESNARWVQDFRLKAYASPAKLESIDGARYHALLIPSCPGALVDLASSGSLARILQHFHSESKPICAVGHGVAALCCATSEDRSWVFQGYSVTGPSVYELVRAPGFAHLPLIVEDFVKDAGACFSASEPDAMHVVLDRHLVTGQNASSTIPAVQNLLFLCGSRK
uniref:Glutamine amidotransferase-like class 1 domain-containing protein 1 n=1 Tax=Bos indicus x Bos taurus TaxID=30522 RepID=A0A4W2IQI3_BOBOX